MSKAFSEEEILYLQQTERDLWEQTLLDGEHWGFWQDKDVQYHLNMLHRNITEK